VAQHMLARERCWITRPLCPAVIADKCVLFFADDSDLVGCVFQSACEFVDRIPIQRLTFVPDSRAWSMIQ
jgi:hypothetical protein